MTRTTQELYQEIGDDRHSGNYFNILSFLDDSTHAGVASQYLKVRPGMHERDSRKLVSVPSNERVLNYNTVHCPF